MYRATHTHHEYMNEHPTKFVLDVMAFLELPSKVKKSVFYFLKKINKNNLRTKSARKMMIAIILATRAQRYTLSIKELQKFFYDRYGKKFKWRCINKILMQFPYKALTRENYIEKEMCVLGLDNETKIKVRQNLVTSKRKGDPIVDAQKIIFETLQKLDLHYTHQKERHKGIRANSLTRYMAVKQRQTVERKRRFETNG